MKRRKRWALGGALIAVAVMLVVPAVVAADPDSSATVSFGNVDVGSSFPPAPPGLGHDLSANAQFNLVPRTVAISRGGSVTYDIEGPPSHQVAVCEEGMTPDDVAVPPSGTLINDPDCPTVGSATSDGERIATFSDPGRYLVLCNIRGHFVFFNMHGSVNVK